MEKIKVKDTRNGKVSTITRNAFNQLKAGGHAKHIDVIGPVVEETVHAAVKTTSEDEDPGKEAEEGSSKEKQVADPDPGEMTAKEKIAMIRAAGSIDEIDALVEGEERTSVLKAAQARKAAFETA